MGAFSKIREYFFMASGDFAKLFKGIEIPQLPEAVASLIREFNRPEPDIPRLTKAITSDVEITTSVLRTVNSAYYGMACEVASVQNAITLLGLRSIRSIALSYSMRSSLPCPEGGLFDLNSFWNDSLIRALMARSLAHKTFPREEDEAFTAGLLSDMALPVLLTMWNRYYNPIIEAWRTSNDRLSRIELADFGWDHGQAGAWILRSWGFSDELVSLVGMHTLSLEKLRDQGLENTIAVPVVVAALLPSVQRPSVNGSEVFLKTARASCGLTGEETASLIESVMEQYEGVREQFGIRGDGAREMFEGLKRLFAPRTVEEVK